MATASAKQSEFQNVDACTPLEEDDAPDVSDEVYSLASKHSELGRALGIPPSKVKEIQGNNPNNAAGSLNDVLCEWLKKNYKVEKFGEPSWKKLCEAVAKPSGGNNRALAMEIAKRHPAKARAVHIQSNYSCDVLRCPTQASEDGGLSYSEEYWKSCLRDQFACKSK